MRWPMHNRLGGGGLSGAGMVISMASAKIGYHNHKRSNTNINYWPAKAPTPPNKETLPEKLKVSKLAVQ